MAKRIHCADMGMDCDYEAQADTEDELLALVVDHARLENFWAKRAPDEWTKEPPGSFNTARSLFPRGPIQLQTHGGEIRWRNVFLREIGAEEAEQIHKKGKQTKA